MIVLCENCQKKVTKNEQGLNKKLISKTTKQFLCINCLANYLSTTVEELNDKIKQFQEEGCKLFI